jgi:hypothetical protein
MKHLLLAIALLTVPLASHAQAAPSTTYEFLTLLESEAQQNSFAKIMFAPAFQGKTEIQLENLPGTVSGNKFMTIHRQNVEIVNQQLEAVTAAGWELVHVSADDRAREYLFRRLKK